MIPRKGFGTTLTRHLELYTTGEALSAQELDDALCFVASSLGRIKSALVFMEAGFQAVPKDEQDDSPTAFFQESFPIYYDAAMTRLELSRLELLSLAYAAKESFNAHPERGEAKE